jgi:hypothetical protein
MAVAVALRLHRPWWDDTGGCLLQQDPRVGPTLPIATIAHLSRPRQSRGTMCAHGAMQCSRAGRLCALLPRARSSLQLPHAIRLSLHSMAFKHTMSPMSPCAPCISATECPFLAPSNHLSRMQRQSPHAHVSSLLWSEQSHSIRTEPIAAPAGFCATDRRASADWAMLQPSSSVRETNAVTPLGTYQPAIPCSQQCWM